MHQKVALVTGGAGSIGRSIVQKLADVGMKVLALDASPTVHEIVIEGVADDQVITLQVDLSDALLLDQTIQSILQSHGRVDVLINNAAIHPKLDGNKYLVEQIERDAWKQVFDVNLTGPFVLSAAFLPGMKISGWGRVVNISSRSAMGRPSITSSHYVASKAALSGLTRCIAEEGAQYGVTANSIAPGPIKTDLTQTSSTEAVAEMASRIPIGRYGKSHEVASMVAYLCGDDASFITGTTIDVDGGVLMRP